MSGSWSVIARGGKEWSGFRVESGGDPRDRSVAGAER